MRTPPLLCLATLCLAAHLQVAPAAEFHVSTGGNDTTGDGSPNAPWATVAHAASQATDDFEQRHKVPEGIDLDQMSSSFSSDGILVIRAPRIKRK